MSRTSRPSKTLDLLVLGISGCSSLLKSLQVSSSFSSVLRFSQVFSSALRFLKCLQVSQMFSNVLKCLQVSEGNRQLTRLRRIGEREQNAQVRHAVCAEYQDDMHFFSFSKTSVYKRCWRIICKQSHIFFASSLYLFHEMPLY